MRLKMQSTIFKGSSVNVDIENSEGIKFFIKKAKGLMTKRIYFYLNFDDENNNTARLIVNQEQLLNVYELLKDYVENKKYLLRTNAKNSEIEIEL